MKANHASFDGEGLVILAEQLAEVGGVERIVHTLLRAHPKASVVAGHFHPRTDMEADDFAVRARRLGIPIGANGSQQSMRLLGPGGHRSVYLGRSTRTPRTTCASTRAGSGRCCAPRYRCCARTIAGCSAARTSSSRTRGPRRMASTGW